MRYKIALVTTLAITLTACGANRQLAGYKSLAELGSGFEALTGKVIDQGIDRHIEADSYIRFNSHNSAGITDLGQLSEADKAVISYVKQADAIKQHTSLLSAYFLQLKALASVDGESSIANSTTGILGGLETISKSLKLSDDVETAIGGIAGRIFVHKQNGMIKRELEKNGGAILKHLALQTNALEVLYEDILTTEQDIANSANGLAVHRAFGAQEPLKADWVEKRRLHLLSLSRLGRGAGSALSLSRKLQTAFAGLVEGRISPDELALLTRELEQTSSLFPASK